MIINAPAKLNLTFEIKGKREDGYHNLKTIMQTVDIYDRLHIVKASDLELTGCLVAPFEDNTIIKAVRELEKFTGQKLPCHIHLDKTIPIGAGLGGGSSDAAATLWAVNSIYNLKCSVEDILQIGAKVGSDVPFFVIGGKSLVEGRGEIVTPLASEEGRFLYLVFRPHKRISSHEAYEEYDRTGKSFADQAREKCPQLDRVYHFFRDALVSGKGPTTWVRRDYMPATFEGEPV